MDLDKVDESRLSFRGTKKALNQATVTSSRWTPALSCNVFHDFHMRP
jgi:hypothetical protein